VSISNQVGDVPQARITLPADATLRRLGAEDRVRATVFFYDSVRTVKEGKDPDWRLLFDGEIVDYGYTNSAQGRELYYTATDFVAVLTQVYPLFVAGLTSLTRDAVGTGANTAGVAVNPMALTHTLFTIGLASGEVIQRPYEFVTNVLHLLMGEGATESAKSVVSTQWFKKWVDRTKFLRRIIPSYDVPVEGGTDQSAGFPILRAAQDDVVIQSLSKQGDQIANNASYYRLIQTVFQRVYYEFNAILAPPCVSVNRQTGFVAGPPGMTDTPAQYTQDTDFSAEEDTAYGPALPVYANALGQHITQPRNFFGVPPKCNVVWPSMTLQHGYNENFATQPTRTYLGNMYTLDLLTGNSQVGAISRVLDNAMTVGYPEEASRALDMKKSGGSGNLNNFLVYPEEFFRGPVYNKMNTPAWFSFINDDKTNEGDDRIHRLYTAMEHHRKRLSRRNGSVSMVFNPYMVVGHPCAIIDNVESNHHVFGYVASINHNLNQSGMSTSMSYTYGQTFEELFETLADYRGDFASVLFDDDEAKVSYAEADIICAPIHPIEELRSMFQTRDNANKYFQNILWQNSNETSVFDWRSAMGVLGRSASSHAKRPVEDIDLNLENTNAVANDAVGYIPEYTTKPAFDVYMQDPRKALEYVSRPVCTLDEYAEFQGGYGRKEGLRLSQNPREGKAAPYYVKILGLVQGPGEEMGQTATGGRCSVIDVDTRRNWESRLLKFRHKVYYEDYPHLA